MPLQINSPANLHELDPQQSGNLIEPLRRELQAHCCRMLGPVIDAEEIVEELQKLVRETLTILESTR